MEPDRLENVKTWADVERIKNTMPHPAYRALCLEIGRQLSAQKPWHDGLAFFKKTNVKYSWNIASRHRKHQLCWSWIIHLTLGGYNPYWFNFSRWNYRWNLRLLKVISLGYQRQPSDWMLWIPFDTKVNLHAIGKRL